MTSSPNPVENAAVYVGIDVAKNSVEVGVDGQTKTESLSNDARGHKALLLRLKALSIQGIPLGFLNVKQCWSRDPAEFGKKKAQRHILPIEDKESFKGLKKACVRLRPCRYGATRRHWSA